MHNKQNIVITGGNRGIGYGLLKILSDKHNIIITVKDNKKGQSTIAKLGHSKNEINYVVMDVDNSDSVLRAADDIKQRFNIDKGSVKSWQKYKGELLPLFNTLEK